MGLQVKSKQRVLDHGEVFTSEREVNAMLDLVKDESERIDSRFLEPACGNGNFLAEVLNRKLSNIPKKYNKSQREWERYALIGVSSIYGVDVLNDNTIECRERLFGIFIKIYSNKFGTNMENDFLKSIRFILHRNILCGDALTMLKNDGKPIVFSEWSPINGVLIKRRDFLLSFMLARRDQLPQIGLFGDDGKKAHIPVPVKEYPPIHFLKLADYDKY